MTSSSNPTALAKLLESVSLSEASAAEQALSNLFGVKIPLDARVDSAAGFIATKLGLQSKNSTIQTGVFVLTKAAILETAQLVGIGAGLAKIDLMSFEMAQLKKQVEEINAKLDVILSAPLKLAVDFFGKAMRHMESENISGVLKEMEEVKRQAMQAFRYAEGQGAKNKNLKSAVLATQLVILAEILVESYDQKTIVPFSLLDEKKKRAIALLIEDEITSMQTFHNSYSGSMLTFNKAEKAKKKQDILDRLLQSAYPFISEGRGLTSPLKELKLPSVLRVLPVFLPEGKEDSASLIIGQQEGRQVKVEVWRQEDRVFCSFGCSAKIKGQDQVTLHITG